MRSLYAGLDVADRTACICVVDEIGSIILEETVATTPTAIAAALRSYKRRLRAVGQETGTKAAWLHRELVKQRLPMVCLDARHAQAAMAARRNKTDKNDARGLATLLSRGMFTTAHVKSQEALALRLLLGVRKTVQRKALDLETSLRMSLKSFGGSIESRRRRVVSSRIKIKDARLRQLFEVMERTSALLMEEVKALDKLVVKSAAADPICRRLMTVPGVGPITALTFRASVDDPSRFKCSRDVAAYFGLTPHCFQSGQTAYSGHITGWGDPSVRAALYDAACSLLNTSRSDSGLRRWALELAKRKGFKLAATASARRLAVIMHRMWMSGEDFDPART